jgi:hypothetical protein
VDATISIGADVKNALRGIERINDRLERMQRVARTSATSLKGMQRAAGAVNSALRAAGAALVAFGTQRAISGIVDATLQMEQFRTQLTAYLGDQRLANAEIERLSKLARGLPQDVNELTNAFVILERNGISTSNEAMTAFAKVAAGNSKSMTQFAEAVADAMTDEFERLKEFGVKVSQEANGLSARFSDGTTKMVANSRELVEELKAMGEEGGRFANVAAGNLTQALSNLRGAVFETNAALGGQGLSAAIADVATRITDLITNNKPLVREIGVNLTKAFLAVVAVGEFVVKNLGLIGKVMVLLLKIKLAMWAIGIVKALYSMVVGIAGAIAAIAGWGKSLVNVGKILISFTPAGRIGKAVLLGISALGAAWAYLRGETEDTAEATEDSAGVIEQAFTDAFGALNVQGLDELVTAFETIPLQAERYADAAQEAADALSDQEAAAARAVRTETARATKEQQRADAFTVLLDKYKQETEIMRMRVEQGEIGVLQKQQEIELGERLTEQERERLEVAVRQRRITQEQLKYQAKVAQYAENILEASMLSSDVEIRALEESHDRAIELINERVAAGVYSKEQEVRALLELDLAYQNERYNLDKRMGEKLNDLYLTQAKRRVSAEISLEYYKYAQLTGANKANMLQNIGNQEKIEEMVADRIEFEKKSEFEKTQFAVQQLGTVFDALGAQNKKAFEAAKAFNIANAIMNTYMGATKALATYPPPFNFIAAAAVVAAGLAQVASIRSQQYSGRALGGPVMGNSSYIVGENGPELFTPTTNGNITRNGDLNRGEPVNINFNIQANDASGFDDLLIQRRGLITQMISDAMTERGQRSML